MSNNSDIQWTDATWNFLAGCSLASPGCTHCYAMKMAHRLHAMGQTKYAGTTRKVNGQVVWTGKINVDEKAMRLPLSWTKPRKVFVNSMSDLFHPDVAFEVVDKAFAVMALTPQHTYQILTKRPERMAEYLNETWQQGTVCESDGSTHNVGPLNREEVVKDAAITNVLLGSIGDEDRFWTPEGMAISTVAAWPLPNVWLGCSVENQKFAHERVSHLLKCPASVRFLSCEPLLGPIDLMGTWGKLDGTTLVAAHGIDWCIVGGESGKGARPFNVAWARSIIDQCKSAGVPCFVKQLGANVEWDAGGFGDGPSNVWPRTEGSFPVPGGRWRKHLIDKKGGDMSEWPEDLRIREFPAPRAAAGKIGATE